VISDRFLDSSLVYQSLQGKDQETSMEWIKEINKFSFLPDLTIIIDITPEVTMARKAAMMQNSAIELEKFENEAFLDHVRQGFLERAQAGDPLKYAIIDGDQSIEEVTTEILERIQPLLKKKKLLK
jgi:dTMP kinase